MANQDDHNQKVSFSTWYKEKYGNLSIFSQGLIWLLGGLIWVPALYLYSGKERGGLDESSRNKCIIAIGLSVLVLFFNIYIDPYIQKAEAEKKQIAAQLVAKEKAEKKAELENQLAKDFAENQEKILSDVKKLLEQKEYSKVAAISSKYAFLHNPELEHFGQEAHNVLQQIARDIALQKKMEKAKNDMEKYVSIAQTRCKRAAVDSAKYDGAESDFSDKSTVYFEDVDKLRVVGNDVKMKNAL